MEAFTVELEHRAEETVAQPDGAADDCVEHRLDVGRRAADHPQDLARRRLLLERLGHLRVGLRDRAVLLLQFREQPDVLDGDDGLVGEASGAGPTCVSEKSPGASRANADERPMHRPSRNIGTHSSARTPLTLVDLTQARGILANVRRRAP